MAAHLTGQMFQATHLALSILPKSEHGDVKRWLRTDAYELSFTGAFFRALGSCPLVYVFLKNGLASYVGLSRRGIGRPLNRGHVRRVARQMADDVRVFLCRDVQSAKELEGFLIAKLNPVLNKSKGTKPNLGTVLKMVVNQ